MLDGNPLTFDGEQIERDRILNTKKLAQALDELETSKKFTWYDCLLILESYRKETQIKEREEIGLEFLQELQAINDAHSIRLRHKGGDSLIRKIVERKAAGAEKYDAVNSNNYDKLVTDLIGARILIRYKHQWKSIHDQIVKLFCNPDSNRKFINSVRAIETVRYPPSPNTSINEVIRLLENDGKDCYFFEEPKAYVRDETEMALYLNGGMQNSQVEVSKRGYRSIHYIIRYFGHHIELQVRTIFEEGWSECDHDLCYKEPDLGRKKLQGDMSKLLGGLAHQADEVSSLMYALKEEYEICVGQKGEKHG